MMMRWSKQVKISSTFEEPYTKFNKTVTAIPKKETMKGSDPVITSDLNRKNETWRNQLLEIPSELWWSGNENKAKQLQND